MTSTRYFLLIIFTTEIFLTKCDGDGDVSESELELFNNFEEPTQNPSTPTNQYRNHYFNPFLNNEYDYTDTLTHSIVNTLKNFRNNIVQRNQHTISFENDVIPLNLQTNGTNYTISFHRASFAMISRSDIRGYSINCEFSRHLQASMSFSTELNLRGNFHFTYTNTSANSHEIIPPRGEYTISFNDLTVSFTKPSTSNYDNASSEDDPASFVDITYKNFKIELTTHPDLESAAMAASGELLQQIKSSLKLKMKEKFADYLTLSSSVYKNCTQPRTIFTQKYDRFLASENKYYYPITGSSSDTWNTVRFDIDRIIIQGLSNYRSLNINHNRNSAYDFNLSINNVTMQIRWSYRSNSRFQRSVQDFKANPFKISGTIYSDDVIGSINVYIPSLEIISATCQDKLNSFGEAIIIEKVKSIVQTDIVQKIQERFNRFS